MTRDQRDRFAQIEADIDQADVDVAALFEKRRRLVEEIVELAQREDCIPTLEPRRPTS